MELNQVQRELITRGYDTHCSEIERLIETRLNTDMLELYEVLLSDRKADIKRYCSSNEIDLLEIDEDTKQSIALNLIEIEIKTLLTEKGRYDAELKELDIRTKRITNRIENCPWFSIFNSPVSLHQWERIKNLLPAKEGTVGVTAKNNRLFVEAVLYRYRAGIAWRDLPSRFGDLRVVHTRHSRWSKKRTWQMVFQHLAEDSDNEYQMLDATVIRAHQHSAGAKNSDKKTNVLVVVSED